MANFGVCFSQSEEQTLEISENYFEINYPNYYYIYRFDRRFRVSLPLLNIGAAYRKTYEGNHGFHTGLSFDYLRDLKTADSFGNIAERLVLYASFGFHKRYSFVDEKLKFDIGVDVIGRIGQITTFGHSNEFEAVFGFQELLDAGLSLGTKLYFNPRKKMTYSIGLKHSFFAYVLEKKIELYNIPSSPRNVTTLTLGLGLNFKKSSQ